MGILVETNHMFGELARRVPGPAYIAELRPAALHTPWSNNSCTAMCLNLPTPHCCLIPIAADTPVEDRTPLDPGVGDEALDTNRLGRGCVECTLFGLRRAKSSRSLCRTHV